MTKKEKKTLNCISDKPVILFTFFKALFLSLKENYIELIIATDHTELVYVRFKDLREGPRVFIPRPSSRIWMSKSRDSRSLWAIEYQNFAPEI